MKPFAQTVRTALEQKNNDSAILNSDPVLDCGQASEYLNVPAKSLANMRSRGEGPQFFKIGGRVRYRQSALDGFLARCEAA